MALFFLAYIGKYAASVMQHIRKTNLVVGDYEEIRGNKLFSHVRIEYVAPNDG